MALDCYVGRKPSLHLFLHNAVKAKLVQCLMPRLIVASPLLGLYYLGSGFLQAAKNITAASEISVLRQGIFLIPALHLINALLRFVGIAIAYTLSIVRSDYHRDQSLAISKDRWKAPLSPHRLRT